MSGIDWAEAVRTGRWRRVRGEKTDATGAEARCDRCGSPIHNPFSYYRRPAFTDGTHRLCKRCYETVRDADDVPDAV